MDTPRKIIEAIGEQKIVSLLGVKIEHVRRKKTVRQLPASWFDFCEKMCGAPLDRDLFTFK